MKKLSLLFTFLVATLFAVAQNVTVSGTVTNSAGKGIEGINVLVKGTSKGTITKTDGSFSINAPSNGTLVFSGVGYAQQEVAVNNQASISVTLTESQNELNAVVVTALGITKDSRKLGYAVTSVNGDLLNKARETNVAYSLTGRVAGLNVSGTSGGPGSSARILLRGLTSGNASGPLFVINGVPMDNTQRGSSGEWGGADQGDGIGNLNPDDIESMTVLKGASASALYGTRAANGVILITTKSGKKGTMSVEYNGNYTIDNAVNNTDYQYVYGQGQHGSKPANVTDALNSGMLSWGAKLDGSQVIQFDGKEYPYSAVTDNMKNFYRTAPTFTNTFSFSGGGDNGTYRLSLSNMDNQSILRNSGVKRNTINLSLNQKFFDKLSVNVTANYIDESSKNRPQLSDGPLNANNINFLATSVNQVALQPGYDVNSPVGAEIQYNDDIYVTNPWFVVNRYINNVDRKRLISSISARYNFTDWLYAQARLGYDLLNDRYFSVTPTGTAYSGGNLGGLNNLSTGQTTEMNADVLVGAKKNITKDIAADVSVGANLRENKSESIGINGGPFVIPFFYSPYNVSSFGRNYGFQQQEVHSAYYTVDFSYKNFLTLSTTGRYDAFSTLPANNNSIFTPSVSGSFVFSELVHIPNLNYGKLRVSYAQTSGDPGEAYKTSQYYSVGSTINGMTTGSFSSQLPNLFLKPFTLTEYETGLELKLLNSRLGFDIAYYNRKTANEITNGSLSESTGYSNQYLGTGSTQNSGLELLITGNPIRQKEFNWNVSFNFTTVKNKIVEIDGSGNANESKGLGTYRPLNANTALVKGLAGPQVMAYDYLRDASGNIIIDATGVPIRGALTPMGSVLPNVYGGLNNEFSYKSFSFAFLIDYKFGNKVLSATNYYTIFRGLNKMTLDGRETGVVADGVLEDGSKNTINVDAQTYYQNLARRISALNVLDGDFIKLRQVTLGYTFDKKMLGRLPFKSITLSFVARNLLTLMKNTDNIDPEAGFSSQVNYAGIEGNSLPSTRTFGLNLNVKF
ncbi:SusC/RagA family TonB-linked outer membrane protein [Panacibacter ginsenosidivorans]|uniref:SusC/RagA family TonB-linked outer membrane protein n=1 Tax=Panacibacter ginsenosidivorans TaxID=1813871 RepID=A0A5B8V732_9BACT|nr:SusC/RagA family TonB-linked outer membrane protein [Panacibacter ginsenosidivorans]QEC67310.1 SusC/RagA family TonB-linked outer membrane protein [Panacibacter ginsenosidivorans]